VEISKFCGKGQILRLGLKFRDPWKTGALIINVVMAVTTTIADVTSASVLVHVCLWAGLLVTGN